MALTDLSRTTDQLHGAIYDGLWARKKTAKDDCRHQPDAGAHRHAVGVLLMTGLLRFFYRWTFTRSATCNRASAGWPRATSSIASRSTAATRCEELAAAFNDMTGRLRDMYRDLARQVNERSRQLVRSERLAGVGFLAAGVAHEINNPLASIAFCSEALEAPARATLLGAPAACGRPTATDREVVAKYLKMIQEEAFRCKEITQRLLDFSRGGERKREPTDLGELIQAVLDMVQHLQNCKGKQIVSGCEQAPTEPSNSTMATDCSRWPVPSPSGCCPKRPVCRWGAFERA